MQWILLAFLKAEDLDYFVQSYHVLLAFQGTLSLPFVFATQDQKKFYQMN
jgi:hypothetical protein